MAEGFTLSNHLTERLDAPDQETALLQGIEETRTHGDRLLSTKRLSIGRRHHHKQVHDRIWKLAQHPVHLCDPAFMALQQSRTHVGRRSLQRTLAPHLLSPNNDEHPVVAFIQETGREGEE